MNTNENKKCVKLITDCNCSDCKPEKPSEAIKTYIEKQFAKTDTENKQEDMTVTHGIFSHSINTCDICQDCIKAKQEFEKAKNDGTLDKILGTDKQEEWEHNKDIENSFNKWVETFGIRDSTNNRPDWFSLAFQMRYVFKDFILHTRTLAYSDGYKQGRFDAEADLEMGVVRNEAAIEALQKVKENIGYGNMGFSNEKGEVCVKVKDLDQLIKEYEGKLSLSNKE